MKSNKKEFKFLLPERIWQCKTTRLLMKLQKPHSLQQIYLSTIGTCVKFVYYDFTGNNKICKYNLEEDTIKTK